MKKGAMAKSMKALLPTKEDEDKELYAKKTAAKLDPAKDYTADEKCLKCHTTPAVEKFYAEAEHVVESTNALIAEADQIMKGLHADGLLSPEPFDEPVSVVVECQRHDKRRKQDPLQIVTGRCLSALC